MPRLSNSSSIAVACVLLLLAAGCGPVRLDAPTPDAQAARSLRMLLSVSDGAKETDGPSEAVTGTGWGALTGRFVFVGTPPEPKPLVVDKDTEVCTAGGQKLFDRSLLVDPSSGGLANVVVFARKVARVKERSNSGGPLVLDQKVCEFLTPVLAAQVGQQIEVRNSDPVGHNTNISGTSFNQLIAAGQGTLYTPDREVGMPVAVTCNIHPWMKAHVIFRKDGYVAVSGTDGSFSIADLPAGEPIEFQVWHERSTGPNGAIAANRPDLKWSAKGRFVVTLEADQTADLGSIEIPASAVAN